MPLTRSKTTRLLTPYHRGMRYLTDSLPKASARRVFGSSGPVRARPLATPAFVSVLTSPSRSAAPTTPGDAARTRPAANPKKLKDGDAQQPRQPPAVGEPQPAVVGESIQGAGAGAGAEQWRGRARRLPRDPKGRRPGQRRGVGQSGRARVPPVDRPRRRLPVAPVPRPQVRRGRTS